MKSVLFVAMFFITHLHICAQLKVSCTGTSITAGYGIADSLSYPAQQQKILHKNIIGNFGVSASTILSQTNYAYINSANYINAQNFNPNVVIVEFGTNDSQPQYWNNYKDSFVYDYTSFINTFKALPTHPLIYACLPIPAISSLYGISDSTITYEIIPLIKSIAAANNINLIDLNAPFKNHPEYYQADGIHPNATGAKILAQVIAKSIAAPEYLTASVISSNEVKLNWISNNNEKGITVQRSTDSISWKTICKLSANTNKYVDSTLTDSGKYFYRINAAISSGGTVFSRISISLNYHNTLIPSITSAAAANGSAGTAFNYKITATNHPAFYSATGLPVGLTLNTSTGRISGTPQNTDAITFIVLLSASNSYGTSTKALKLYLTSATLIAKGNVNALKQVTD